MESALQLTEGKTREWGSGYRYRVDRRPPELGGDQIHVWGPHGQAWANRSTGARSEPSKYALRTNNTVKDIVADVFGIPRDIVELRVVDAQGSEILMEATFK
jgi:hypothetical protein